jgi:hypothetical protein
MLTFEDVARFDVARLTFVFTLGAGWHNGLPSWVDAASEPAPIRFSIVVLFDNARAR